MIKFRSMHKDGTPVYGFGLSAENIKRLKQGKPIAFSLHELGTEGHILIYYGATEQSMTQELLRIVGEYHEKGEVGTCS